MLELAGITGLYIFSWYLYFQLKLKMPGNRILAFHDVSDKPDLSITRIAPDSFERILKFVHESGTVGTSISSLNDRDSIAVTFDDGWQGFYSTAFPILNKFDFKATVFIVAGYVGKTSGWDYRKKAHLNWQEITELAQEGIEIGSHSVNHLDLRRLDKEKLAYEISGSKKMLEDKLGLPVKYFSYPFGRFNQRVIEAVKDAGYEKAFALSTGGSDYAIPRRAVYLYDTPYSVYLKLFRNSWLEGCKDYINNSLAGGTIVLKKIFPGKTVY
jgi:peptidoglycan/xylan/chitin deacetylase (PgdA/CDA1 family)